MKFSTREDIEAPAGTVFAAASDFAAFERAALRRGAEVARADLTAPPGAGTAWSVRFPVRGRMRRLVCTLDHFDPPNGLVCRIDGSGFGGAMTLNLVALSRGRTRLAVQLEIRPLTIAARLMVQAARLNRGAHVRRFEERVQRFAAQVELREAQRRSG
ncbi:SRPBCC family protein [Albidovulum sp.]|uniref:SRPBCC family protein n=1 Tax=Albidovulum sp. TaxID=1872424 RepID=UPI0039B88204